MAGGRAPTALSKADRVAARRPDDVRRNRTGPRRPDLAAASPEILAVWRRRARMLD